MIIIIFLLIISIMSNVFCWYCLWEFAKTLDESTKTVSKITITAPETIIRESLDELTVDDESNKSSFKLNADGAITCSITKKD